MQAWNLLLESHEGTVVPYLDRLESNTVYGIPFQADCVI